MSEKSNLITSDVTGITYDPKEVVRLLNAKQIALFIRFGCKVVDIYDSVDFKTGEPVLVVLFYKKETAVPYDLWCKHELK